jgi:hypothetical protein
MPPTNYTTLKTPDYLRDIMAKVMHRDPVTGLSTHPEAESAMPRYGVTAWGEAHVTLQACTILNMTFNGVCCTGCSRVEMEDCVVSGCGMAGVYLEGDTNATLTACHIKAPAHHTHRLPPQGPLHAEPTACSPRTHRLRSIGWEHARALHSPQPCLLLFLLPFSLPLLLRLPLLLSLLLSPVLSSTLFQLLTLLLHLLFPAVCSTVPLTPSYSLPFPYPYPSSFPDILFPILGAEPGAYSAYSPLHG